jgi:hypothetical protein
MENLSVLSFKNVCIAHEFARDVGYEYSWFNRMFAQ